MRETAYATAVKARLRRAFLFFARSAGLVNRIDRRTRYAAFLLFIGLLACICVAGFRLRVEQRTQRVEIAMDYNDFLALTRSYNYKPVDLLVQLRRAGLTSLALSEELGSSLSGSASPTAYAISGIALNDAARVSSIANPTLADLVRRGMVRSGSVYLLVYDKPAFDRYLQQLPLHYERSGIRVLHASVPYVIALRTQSDFFNSTSLGIPGDQVQLARKLGFFVIPRFQNDERLQDGQIAQMFDDLHAGKWISTVIFFGLRNQVLGFPDHVADTAAVFKARKATNFGEIETYDAGQVQKGNDELAREIPGQTVRVQAISKLELDKLDGAANRRALRAGGARAQRTRRLFASVRASIQQNVDREDQRRDREGARVRSARPRISAGTCRPRPAVPGKQPRFGRDRRFGRSVDLCAASRVVRVVSTVVGDRGVRGDDWCLSGRIAFGTRPARHDRSSPSAARYFLQRPHSPYWLRPFLAIPKPEQGRCWAAAFFGRLLQPASRFWARSPS